MKDPIALRILSEGRAHDALTGPRHFLVGMAGGFVLGVSVAVALLA